MGCNYPIGAVSQLTGLPLDTLRAWERRYRVVKPRRSARGRVYTQRQVQRLMLLSKAVASGHAIGRVANVGDPGLRHLLDNATFVRHAESLAHKQTEEDLLAPVLRAIERFDYGLADRELNRLTAAIASPRNVVFLVALPLMRSIGERWHQGKCSIAQEHMLTSLLTALLCSLIRVYTPSNPPARILFATLRNEHHGFSNLAAAMLTAAGGLGVIHLGTDLPREDIVLAARKSGANGLLLSVSQTPNAEFGADMAYIARHLPKETALCLGGATDLLAGQRSLNSRWQLLHNFPALERALEGLGARL
jgi:MerR family transcriptional regulator, light-induced transcriptional regulator